MELSLDLILDIASSVLLIIGSLSLLVAGLGILRLPDFYARLHGAGITDTLGAEMIIFALILQAGWSLVAVKLLIIGVFLFFTSPTSTHAIANAAYVAGLKPLLGNKTSDDDGAPDARN